MILLNRNKSGNPKIKPMLWGPPSAVQSAVIHHYNDVLGVAAPIVFVPFIEGGGSVVHNYGTAIGYDGTLNGDCYWDSGQVFAGGSVDDYISFSHCEALTHLNRRTSVVTRLSRYTHEGSSSTSCYILPNILESYYSNILYFYKNPSSTILVRYSIVGYSQASPSITVNASELQRTTTVGLSLQSNDATLFFNGEVAAVDTSVSMYLESNYGNPSYPSSMGGDADGSFAGDLVAIWADYYLPADVQASINEQPYAAIQPYAPPRYFDLGGGATPIEGTVSISGGGTISVAGTSDRASTIAVSAPANLTLSGEKSAQDDIAISAPANITLSGEKEAQETLSVSGAGEITATGFSERSGTVAVTTTANVRSTGNSDRDGSVAISTSANVSITGTTDRPGQASVSGAGTVSISKTTDRFGQASVSGNGNVSVTGSAEEQESAEGTANVTGGGSVSISAFKSTNASVSVSDTGDVSTSGQKQVSGSLTVTGAGEVLAAGLKNGYGIAEVTGAGVISASGTKATSGTAQVSDVPSITVSYTTERFQDILITGSGEIVIVGGSEPVADIVDQVPLSGSFIKTAALDGTYINSIDLDGAFIKQINLTGAI